VNLPEAVAVRFHTPGDAHADSRDEHKQQNGGCDRTPPSACRYDQGDGCGKLNEGQRNTPQPGKSRRHPKAFERPPGTSQVGKLGHTRDGEDNSKYEPSR